MASIAEVYRTFPLTIGALLDLPLLRAPDSVALRTEHRTLTYRELDERVAQRSAAIEACGLRRFDRCAVALGNTAELLEWCFALARAGCIAVPLRADLGGAERAEIERALELAATISPDGVRRLRRGAPAPPAPAAAAVPIDVDPALILATAGSEGQPRYVVLQHHAVIANVVSNVRALGLRDEDRTLVVLPLVHAYALINQAFSHLAVGATVCLPEAPLAPPLLARALERFEVTTLATVPALLRMLLAGEGRTFPNVRLLTVGAAYAPPALIAACAERFPRAEIALTYGLTQAGPRVTTRFVGRDETDTSRLGAPNPNVEVAVVASEDGRSTIRVRSRSVLRSYADEPFEEGADWSIATGDIGEIRAGELYLTGRSKRVINRAGRLVSAETIERVLQEDPRVRRAYAEAEEHPFWGEVAVVSVYVGPGHADLDVQQLAARCRRALPPAERPHRIRLCVCASDDDALGVKDRALLAEFGAG